MFRLVKVLNGNTQADIHLIPDPDTSFSLGNAVVCHNNKTEKVPATGLPEYIILGRNYVTHKGFVAAQLITEDSIFKVEYTGSVKPYVGMPVGISTYITGSDAVTYNINGKGSVTRVDNNSGLVYVRFRK